MFSHELWGDEYHSWNIVKASTTLPDLFKNIRYEGHPPAWYLLLWPVSKFTHNPEAIQVLQWLIATAVIFLILFYSPFPVWVKTMLPFGYFFLFEYGILSRNYAIAILFALLMCIIVSKEIKNKWLWYYFFLFLLTNSHLLGVLMAASIHLYVLLRQEKPYLHVLLGLLICIPALYFIYPPSDSGLKLSFWTGQWKRDHLGILAKTPLRVFMPLPAFNKHELWNTQILLEAPIAKNILKPVTLLLSAGFLFAAVYVLKNQRMALTVFVINFLLTAILAAIFPLTTLRYAGFIFIGFVIALWLLYSQDVLTMLQQRVLAVLLLFQILAGLYLVSHDIRRPFSQAEKVKSAIAQLGDSARIVTDYWGVNALSAYTDKKYYTVGLDKEVDFLLWNEDLKVNLNQPYSTSFGKILGSTDSVYLISLYSESQIRQTDTLVMKAYDLTPIISYTGSIEKWSNLYVYRVRRR